MPAQPAIMFSGLLVIAGGLIHPALGQAFGWLAWPFLVWTTAIIEWVCLSLKERAASYRYALERLVIRTPSSNAVEVERSLTLLQTRIGAYCPVGPVVGPRRRPIGKVPATTTARLPGDQVLDESAIRRFAQFRDAVFARIKGVIVYE